MCIHEWMNEVSPKKQISRNIPKFDWSCLDVAPKHEIWLILILTSVPRIVSNCGVSFDESRSFWANEFAKPEALIIEILYGTTHKKKRTLKNEIFHRCRELHLHLQESIVLRQESQQSNTLYCANKDSQGKFLTTKPRPSSYCTLV